jgi:hypothetical protein
VGGGGGAGLADFGVQAHVDTSWSGDERRPKTDRSPHQCSSQLGLTSGHFPNEQAALNCLYFVVRSLDPTGRCRRGWMNRSKPSLNAFAIAFEGRLFPTT